MAIRPIWRAPAPASTLGLLVIRVPIARDEVVIDHADRLHERVDDRRPDELEAALLQFFGDLARQLRLRRDRPARFQMIEDRLAADEVPEELGEAQAFLLHRQ